MLICLQMGKTSKAKTPPGDFKVTTPKNPLYYHNKKWLVKESQYLIPTYSWTLTPIHNWTCSVVTIFPFQCKTPSTWLNQSMQGSKYVTSHQLEKDVGCKVLQFINMMKITKLLGYKTLRRTNVAASSRERWTRENLSLVTMSQNKTFASSFISYDGP